jgi:hypothetical protein
MIVAYARIFVFISIVKLIGLQGTRLLRDGWTGETPERFTARPSESEQPGAEINYFQKQQ